LIRSAVRYGAGVVTALVVASALLALGTVAEGLFYVAVLAAIGLGVVLSVNRPTWRPAMYGVLAGVAGTFLLIMVAISQF
jgi:hypothetical protein